MCLQAVDLYRAAELLPGTSTKAHLFTQHQLRVNGREFECFAASGQTPVCSGPQHVRCALCLLFAALFPDLNQGPAHLLMAARDGCPYVLKLLSDKVQLGSTQRPGGMEAAAAHALCNNLPAGTPIVPCELHELELTEDHRSTGHGPGRYAVLLMRPVSSVMQALCALHTSLQLGC